MYSNVSVRVGAHMIRTFYLTAVIQAEKTITLALVSRSE
jgi:hypothetical protein